MQMENYLFSKDTLDLVERVRLDKIYEALLCGISVMKPRKPYVWIADKLKIIKTMDYDDLKWDTFIDNWMKPKHPFVIEPVLTFLLKGDSDGNEPSSEMLALAYKTYNDSIKRRCFNAIVIYHVQKKKRSLVQAHQIKIATDHYKNQWCRRILSKWKNWSLYCLHRHKVAAEILEHLRSKNTCKNVFISWYKMTKEAKKTREYFEKELLRLEKGDLEKEEDLLNKSDGEARDDLSTLPIYQAIKIFSQLSIVDLAKCSQVCRSWKVISQNDELWNKMNFENIGHLINDRIGSMILQKYRPILCHLNLRGCRNLGQRTFLAVSECKNLRDLNLSECITLNLEWDELLNDICRGCPVLTYLNLSYTDITDNSIRCMAKHASYLQYLSLAHCTKITDESFRNIHRHEKITQLVYIDLSGCSQLTVVSYKFLAEACPKIKEWILNEIPNLSDEHIGAITTFCKHIRVFEARGINQITDMGIKLVFNRQLHVLKLESSRRISDQLKDIGRYCVEIQHLYISDCQKVSDQSLKHFSNLRELRVLNLADCVKMTDQGVKFIVDSHIGPLLRELNLTNALRITDSALNQIQRRCLQLTHLSIAYCTQISEAGMDVLRNLPCLESLDVSGTNMGDNVLSILGNRNRLRYLIVAHCVNVSDLGLQKFAQACREIEHLDISFCYQITDAAMKNLAFCCRFLTYLNLEGCRQLTDLSLQFLSGVCHYITYLNISGCIMITNKSLVYIRKGCHRMKKLKMMFCKGISKKAVLKLQLVFPDIEYSCEDPPAYYGY